MSIPKKGSRKIAVGGGKYRWVFSPDSGYLVIAVQQESGQGQRLEALFRYGHEGGPHESWTPGAVRVLIEYALANGWRPKENRLPPFRVLDADNKVFPRVSTGAG